MPNWIIYGFLSALFASLVAILGKFGLQNVDSTYATTIRAIVMAVFLICVSLVFGKFSSAAPLGNKALIFVVLSGIAGAVSWIFYFLALKNGPASSVSAIDRTSIIFVILLSGLLLGEKLTVKSVSGSLLIALGAFLITLK